MGSRTIIMAVAGAALLSAGSAGAIQEEIHLQGLVDGFFGTGGNFSLGDPFEATVVIDVPGDPVILDPLGTIPISYTLTVGSYSASGDQNPPDGNQIMIVYEQNPTFGDSVVFTEELGDFLGAPPLDVNGLQAPFDFEFYDARGGSPLGTDRWFEPNLSEVLEQLPSLPEPRFLIRWVTTSLVGVEGPITSVTVPEPSAELLRACALLASAGLAVWSRGRLSGRRSRLAAE